MEHSIPQPRGICHLSHNTLGSLSVLQCSGTYSRGKSSQSVACAHSIWYLPVLKHLSAPLLFPSPSVYFMHISMSSLSILSTGTASYSSFYAFPHPSLFLLFEYLLVHSSCSVNVIKLQEFISPEADRSPQNAKSICRCDHSIIVEKLCKSGEVLKNGDKEMPTFKNICLKNSSQKLVR